MRSIRLLTGFLLAACAFTAGVEAPFSTSLAKVTILVHDQDEALKFYTEMLGMEKRFDQTANGMRFLTVAPKGQPLPELILLKADSDKQHLVGKNPTWVIDTDDCRKAYAILKNRGVKFLTEPAVASYGIQATFADLYGNPFALVERKKH
ncbi:MAG: lactoylglutathione lyase [Acidimicrobiia bacterium]|nr:lactoylglutathione lyase [Acidimicrobiia bacterium]